MGMPYVGGFEKNGWTVGCWSLSTEAGRDCQRTDLGSDLAAP